jgi:hypothetical protein
MPIGQSPHDGLGGRRCDHLDRKTDAGLKSADALV